MKKLKLNAMTLGALLTRDQLKSVVGGDYNGSGCPSGCPPFAGCQLGADCRGTCQKKLTGDQACTCAGACA
jgi:hypothetical protein